MWCDGGDTVSSPPSLWPGSLVQVAKHFHAVLSWFQDADKKFNKLLPLCCRPCVSKSKLLLLVKFHVWVHIAIQAGAGLPYASFGKISAFLVCLALFGSLRNRAGK